GCLFGMPPLLCTACSPVFSEYTSQNRWTVSSVKNESHSLLVHPTLGSLRTSQAFFYALSFFWLDGFAVPAPARVTQTVGRLSVSHQKVLRKFSNHIGVENE
ncbi:MAG: hypothetical protein Q8L68_01750, partial [Methylococcales bacterium]|nr:hypothetical protein [Methylococcales bacterium]